MISLNNKSKKKSKSISLVRVSKKLNIPKQQIVDLLRNAGFDILNLPFTQLKEDHLHVLSIDYIKSIKSYHKSVKNYHKLKVSKRYELAYFFSRFMILTLVDENQWLDSVFRKKLNNGLIKEYFFELLLVDNEPDKKCIGYYVYKSNRIFDEYRHKIKIKLRVNNIVDDIKAKLHSILVCYHFHVFSDEEDYNHEANVKLCFSGSIIYSREALKIINYLKQEQKWKKMLNYS